MLNVVSAIEALLKVCLNIDEVLVPRAKTLSSRIFPIASRLSMKSLQEEIDDFQKENRKDINHTYMVEGQSGYYTLGMYDKKGKTHIHDVSTSPKFTKRKGVGSGTLKACRYAWLIVKWQ